MITISSRNTIQKALIYDAVTSVTCHPTAEHIHKIVCEKYKNISLATVYRNLNQLAEEGKILRVKVLDAPDRYDLTVKSHHHFICERCYNVYDIFGVNDPNLNEIHCDQGKINYCEILFSGVCNQCIQNG